MGQSTRQWCLATVAVLGLMLGAPHGALAQVTNRVVTPNSNSSSASIVDTVTGTVLATVPTGLGPGDAAVSPDGRVAYVTSQGDDNVTVIDMATMTVVGSPIATGPVPVGVAFTPDGKKAYVADTNGLTIIDVTTNTVSGTIATASAPLAVVISRDGTRAYTSNFGDDTVSVFDLTTDTQIGPDISVGSGPQGIALTPDGTTLYVVNNIDETVSVIQGGVVTATITVGGGASVIAISPDGAIALVGNSNDGTLDIIDTATNTTGTPINVGSHCGCAGTPSGIVFSPDGKFAFVLSGFTDDVAVIDIASETDLGTYVEVGSTPAALGQFISPNLIVPSNTGPLTTASDADLTPRGFGSFLVFAGGTLQTTADNWLSNRTLSMLGGTAGTINTNGFTATLTGNIFGQSGLVKDGNGRLILTGTLALSGPTTILVGTLEVDGNVATPVFVNDDAGTLAGTGTLSTVNALGGIISPGAGDTPGVLHGGVVAMAAASKLHIIINGPNAGTGYSVLESSSNTLGGGLEVHLGYAPVAGTTFVIATNVTGTFAGLPEGGAINVGGQHLRVTYHGGDGNDAALIADQPPTITTFNNATIPADSFLAPVSFTVGDDLTAVNALTVTAMSSDPSLVTPSGLVITGSGSARALKVTPVPEGSGTTTITVTVSDGFQTTSTSFVLTVLPLPTYYLSEGANNSFFATDLLLANPNNVAAPITITFFRDDATTLIQHRTLPATSRTTIHVKDIEGLDASSFATSVTSNLALPLVVERTMWWDASGYGAHGEKASDGPATNWYFAEGSQGYFHTFFLLLNLHDAPNTAHVTYFPENGAAIQRDYALAETSRRTIDISQEPALANRSFGALVTFDLPGMAERAMYFGDSPLFSGGHDSAGVTAPATSWVLAEGATGTFFDTFVLVANPGDVDATVTMTYLPASGNAIVKTHPVAAHQRLTVNISEEDPTLASAAVGTKITADQPVVVERSVYWPHGNWYEAHNTAAETAPALKWGLAEGRVGGTNNAQTYILLANPGSQAANVTATFLRTNGSTIVKTFVVAPSSRLNIAVTGPGSDVPELANEEFGATIVSSQPIIVERSLYSDANGVTWAAGTNATGTRLP